MIFLSVNTIANKLFKISLLIKKEIIDHVLYNINFLNNIPKSVLICVRLIIITYIYIQYMYKYIIMSIYLYLLSYILPIFICVGV